MPNTYQVGTSTTQISLKVVVGTAANCHSKIFMKASADNQTEIMNSVAGDNGSVPATNIGAANTLDGCMAEVQSIIDFSALPAGIISAIASNNTILSKYLNITYTLNGGTAGEVPFAYEEADCVVNTGGTLASIVVYVSLVA